ncbi:MAG: lysozyme [Rickettsiaceae bacterium]|nr:lysozyme [Rickettsiaceae bacterium]
MHRFTSSDGIEFVKSFEGFKDRPYLCPAGILTIGYGHVISKDENYNVISDDYAMELLQRDLFISERAVLRNINVALSQMQFDALVSFTFNLGSGVLQRSTLRQKINYGATLADIRAEFLRWIYSKGLILHGLVKRRSLEADMYLQL